MRKYVYIIIFCLSSISVLCANPENLKFYARNSNNKCEIKYEKTISGGGTISLKVYSANSLISDLAGINTGNNYTFNPEITGGLSQYKFELIQNGNIIESADNVVCGDAYLVSGQSNGWAKRCSEKSNNWIRSFSTTEWAVANSNGPDGNKFNIGCWGYEIADQIVTNFKIPVFMINTSKGGSQIKQHRRSDSNPADSTTFYGELLYRAQTAELADKVKAVFWHQGENDNGITLIDEYVTDFTQMAANWRGDYPNVSKVYLFQIKPSCYGQSKMVINEAQRKASLLIPEVHIMTTFGAEMLLKDNDGCHFQNDSYVRWGENMFHMVARDMYGTNSPQSVSPPDILQAAFTGLARDEIVLQFDQNVTWEDSLVPGTSEWMDDLISDVGIQHLKDYIFLDGIGKVVESASISQNLITLKLFQASSAKSVSYIHNSKYNDLNPSPWYSYPLIRGTNGVSALTFYNIPIRGTLATNLDEIPTIPFPLPNKLSQVGGTVSFAAVAAGGNLNYQWFKDGAPLAGATGAYYTTPVLTLQDNESEYSFSVSNDKGGLISGTSTLYVMNQVPSPQFNVTSILGPHPTWDVKQPLVIKVELSNRTELFTVPSPWNVINYWYFERRGENRFLNQANDGDTLVTITVAKRVTPENNEDTYQLTFCLDNIINRVCKDMMLTVDTSANSVQVLQEINSLKPIEILGNNIIWNKHARIRIWSVEGKILLDQSHKPGKIIKLPLIISREKLFNRTFIKIDQIK